MKIVKRLLLLISALISGFFLWLLFAPVDIDPKAWPAPEDAGYTDEFTANERLADLERLELPDGFDGPEDIAFGPDGRLYAAVKQGAIVAIDPETGAAEVYAETGGRPLGLVFGQDGTLYVADAYQGLLSISPAKAVKVLAEEAADGSPILYANDLDVTPDGVVYFTDSSTKFGAEEYGGTLEASILELMEHGGNGRILKYDPRAGKAEFVAGGLTFPNGLALSEDGKALLIAETGTYSVLRLQLDPADDPKALIDNLPGFPDNINRNEDGTLWLGLVSPRNHPMDKLSDKPLQRKMVMRLPGFLKPSPSRYGMIVRMDDEGNIIETLQDPSGDYALTTGAVSAEDGSVFISSLTESSVGRVSP